ncbi:histidine kinase [Micromonospora sp. NPDC049204]|uniref:sensor histidine kinase n=1 Tax=Micromonospora sp. NPDC049204 TaxID=3154351 RepID=UPI0033C06800
MWNTTTAIAVAWAVTTAVWAVLAPRRFRHRLAGPLAAVAVLSVVTGFRQPHPVPEKTSLWTLIEIAALLVLLRGVVRWSPARAAVPAACLGVVACALWPVPVLETSSWLVRVGAAMFWMLPALGAVVVGGYPRWQAYRLEEAVRHARRRQQLDLARDLHDFVAHEVSAIVAQAQAARFVADTDPVQAPRALERIERAGLNALTLMDRTVQMLHDADGRAVAAGPGIDGLPAVVEQFGSAGTTTCHLDNEPSAAEALSARAQAAGYRVVVEGLTNVRRHAANATSVTVVVRPGAAGTVDVAVTNDLPPSSRRSRSRGTRGGHGLIGLRDHAVAAGGTLTAGPLTDDNGGAGWRLTATFPGEPPRGDE